MTNKVVGDIMTPQTVSLPGDATIADAARQMRDQDVGDVLIVDDGRIHGVVTDRDIVVRAVAAGRDTSATAAREICSENPAVVQSDTPASEAVKTLREGKVRRLPVVDGNGSPIGAVSIGDLARELDPESALADISGAPPNR